VPVTQAAPAMISTSVNRRRPTERPISLVEKLVQEPTADRRLSQNLGDLWGLLPRFPRTPCDGDDMR
jgi:hypothetical protein